MKQKCCYIVINTSQPAMNLCDVTLLLQIDLQNRCMVVLHVLHEI